MPISIGIDRAREGPGPGPWAAGLCVRHHGCGGHRLALAGERLVGLVAEDFAEVGNRGVDAWRGRDGEGTERETGDGGCRFVVAAPIDEAASTQMAVF
jgi:hypothetical protein